MFLTLTLGSYGAVHSSHYRRGKVRNTPTQNATGIVAGLVLMVQGCYYFVTRWLDGGRLLPGAVILLVGVCTVVAGAGLGRWYRRRLVARQAGEGHLGQDGERDRG